MSKRYRAKEKCFVDHVLREAGEVFEYAGKPAEFLEEVDEDGKPLKSSKGKQEAKAASAEPSKDASPSGKEAI